MVFSAGHSHTSCRSCADVLAQVKKQTALHTHTDICIPQASAKPTCHLYCCSGLALVQVSAGSKLKGRAFGAFSSCPQAVASLRSCMLILSGKAWSSVWLPSAQPCSNACPSLSGASRSREANLASKCLCSCYTMFVYCSCFSVNHHTTEQDPVQAAANVA